MVVFVVLEVHALFFFRDHARDVQIILEHLRVAAVVVVVVVVVGIVIAVWWWRRWYWW